MALQYIVVEPFLNQTSLPQPELLLDVFLVEEGEEKPSFYFSLRRDSYVQTVISLDMRESSVGSYSKDQRLIHVEDIRHKSLTFEGIKDSDAVMLDEKHESDKLVPCNFYCLRERPGDIMYLPELFAHILDPMNQIPYGMQTTVIVTVDEIPECVEFEDYSLDIITIDHYFLLTSFGQVRH